MAKKTFDVDGLTKSFVQNLCDEELKEAGDVAYLVGESGKTWGAALRCTPESKKPVFVSIGHKVDLETALRIVKLSIGKYRIPEPIRQADLRGRQKVKDLFDS